MSAKAQPHPSHDWHNFGEDSEPSTSLMCHRCEICTCHSPELSADPCEFARGGAS